MLEAVRSFAEVFEEYRTRHEVRLLRTELARRRRLDGFAAAVHATRGLAATCAAVAHDGQTAAGVDRLAAAAPGKGLFGGGLRVRAVSGSDRFDRRAGSVRSLERVAKPPSAPPAAPARDRFSALAIGTGGHRERGRRTGGRGVGRSAGSSPAGWPARRAAGGSWTGPPPSTSRESGGATVCAAVSATPR